MIEIRYSPPNELEISGSPSELQNVRQDLLALSAGSRSETVECANANIEPTPYSICLVALHAQVTQGPTKISVIGNEVVTTGSPESFKRFASFFDFPQTAGESQHNHHEYFEGNEYIHEESIPLVIGIRKET